MSQWEWDMLDEAHQRKLISEGRTSTSLPQPLAKAATQPAVPIQSPKARALLERIAQGKEHAYALQQLWISLELCECAPEARQFGIWFVRHEFETVPMRSCLLDDLAVAAGLGVSLPVGHHAQRRKLA